MTIFKEIADQFKVAETAFDKLIIDAAQANDDAAFDSNYEAKARNEQAYFLFLFTRLESVLTTATKNLVTLRATAGNWQDFRIWEMVQKSVDSTSSDRMTLMNKATLMLKKGSTEWSYIQKLYKQRNAIGHGGSTTETFLIEDVATEMDRIVGMLVTT